jgi:tight adherence protein C
MPTQLQTLVSDPKFQLFALLLVVATGIALMATQGILYLRRKRWLKRYQDTDSGSTTREPYFDKLLDSFSFLFSTNEDIQQKFLAAGFYNTRFAPYFMPVKYTVLVLGSTSLYILGNQLAWGGEKSIALATSWLVAAIILPDVYLATKAKNLCLKISTQLPYLLDLMAVCVQTGMTIEATMSYLSKEMSDFDRDLSYMLNITNERSKIVGLDTALEELYQRVPTNEMRSFVMTLTQSLKFGSSIYQTLTTLASDIREVQMLQIEEKIGKLSAKMSVPLILFIMFPIIILVAAPGIMRMMQGMG